MTSARWSGDADPPREEGAHTAVGSEEVGIPTQFLGSDEDDSVGGTDNAFFVAVPPGQTLNALEFQTYGMVNAHELGHIVGLDDIEADEDPLLADLADELMAHSVLGALDRFRMMGAQTVNANAETTDSNGRIIRHNGFWTRLVAEDLFPDVR